MAPRLVPTKYPMLHPMAVAVTPIDHPKRMVMTKIMIGAKLMVERGGGKGIAIMVVTAINADIIPVKDAFFDGEILLVVLWFILSFICFSLRQYYLVQVPKGRQQISRPLSRVIFPAPQELWKICRLVQY
jgi:hypothetical protein